MLPSGRSLLPPLSHDPHDRSTNMTVKTALSLPEPFASIPRHPLLFGPSPIHHLPVSPSSYLLGDHCNDFTPTCP
jgi:hypothetical protein